MPRGTDPITKRYRYAFDSAATLEEAERKRDELIERLAERREPAEKATVSMLLDRWMDVADLALSTRVTHESYIERVIRPALGDWQVRKLERRVDVLDQLYAHLRRCSRLCDGRPFTEHRTHGGAGSPDAGDHDCAAEGSSPHVCRPMSASTIRRIHSNISAAFGFAIKWGWADRKRSPRRTGTHTSGPVAAGGLSTIAEGGPAWGAAIARPPMTAGAPAAARVSRAVISAPAAISAAEPAADSRNLRRLGGRA